MEWSGVEWSGVQLDIPLEELSPFRPGVSSIIISIIIIIITITAIIRAAIVAFFVYAHTCIICMHELHPL